MNFLIKIILYFSIINLGLCSFPSYLRIKTADSPLGPLDKIIKKDEIYINSDSDNVYHYIKVRGENSPGYFKYYQNEKGGYWKGYCAFYSTSDFNSKCLREHSQSYIKVGSSFLSYYEEAKEDGPYKNYYRNFIPEYIYKLRITNYGYTKKNIDINLENHCPPNMEKFLYFEKDNLQNLLSYLTFSLYNSTDFLVICFDPTHKSNSIERDKK